jgi:hypothetical protein
MQEPRWVDGTALLLLRGESFAKHGGLKSVRDIGLMRSALARPRSPLAYGAAAEGAALAAAYSSASPAIAPLPTATSGRPSTPCLR